MAKYYYEKWTIKWKDPITGRILVPKSSSRVVWFDFTEKHHTLQAQAGDVVKARYNNTYIYVYVVEVLSTDLNVRFRNMSDLPILDRFVKLELIETIIADESEYPEASVVEGMYLLIRGEKAFPTLKINGLNVASARLKLTYGDLNIGNVYYKDLNGEVKNLK
ncbi:hypothetical protein [Microaceticoccus formicicus]|uniref:hypothetical protein n=1 Tax=Microaceticoccus formicicus TaxID=3118105 RepID=UPI003CCFF83E|nr:hypothetical protein VZL98_05030 [Peptoniphilaceae bacterium AMB_02]